MPVKEDDKESEDYIYSGIYDDTLPLPHHTPKQQAISQSESPSIVDPRGSSCDVRRCIAKLITQKTNHMSVQSTEREFLQNVKPVHPNIVQYFEITDEYIFMEQCLLGSLDRYLEPGTNPPVVEWTFQLCDALVYIHSLGWAHNQFHPSHILVANHGTQLKICDFSRVTAITGNDHAPEGRGDALDIFSLGLMAWFIQRGGGHVLDGLWTCDTSAKVRSLSTDGLQLTRIMELCWSERDVRPSSVMLRNLLRELLDDAAFNVSTDPSEFINGSNSRDKQFMEEKLAPRVDSFLFNSSNVRLAVVKLPRNLDQLSGPYRVRLLRSCFFQFHLEHTFLRTIKPLHPNIVHYLAITDNCIYTDLYIGSLERYLTPDINPPVFEWTVQLCSALAYLHELGFAHCEIRPYNLLVGNGGSDLLISDFGTVTRAHMPCQVVDEHSPPECGVTIHETERQERPADAADVYCLGLIVWFIQNGGKAIPTNYIVVDCCLEAIHSHLDIVDFTGLQLVDFMRECWAPRISRPSARELLDGLLTHRTASLAAPDRL